jgi:hypothetical protein
MNTPIQRFITGTLMVCFILCPLPAIAKRGDPVAIRHMPGGGFAIESMWNLSVVISVEQFETDQRGGVDVTFSEVRPGESDRPSGRFLASPVGAKSIDYVLDRPANQADPSWQPYLESTEKSANAIRVRTFSGSKLVVVDVDGVRVSYRHHADKSGRWEKKALDAVEGTDAMILTSSGSTADLVKKVEPQSSLLNPRIVIIGTKNDAAAVGNTVSVAAVDASDTAERRTIVLSSEQVELPAELSVLMEKKESSCEASQEVFAALSVNQLNFRPSNGTHTPRWNAEHMMGRELLFFSQIFHALDPTIPVMDLNPKQMPPDYVARHAGWTGEEEARQMERVSAFTRRYVHLIKDLPLDEKAPASGWTPRGLLRQMERHYSEHTANVKKKFVLEDWPQD